MSTTSKNKILVGAVIILLLTNIAMLYFFLNKQPAKKPPRSGREAQMVDFLTKEIGFTTQQLQQYDSLSKQHKEKVKTSFDELRANKEQLYKQLGTQAFGDSSIEEVAVKSAAMQKEMELRMLQHFKAIRQLCTPEQQPKFDSLFYEVWSRKPDNKKKKTDQK